MLAMSDAIALQIATLIVGAITPLGLGYLAYLNLKLGAQQKSAAVDAASQVADVKDALDLSTRKAALRVDLVKQTLDANSVAQAAKVQEVKDSLDASSREAADRVNDVRATLDANTSHTSSRLDKIEAVSKANHVFLNHDRGVLLKKCMEAANELALKTGSEKHLEAARIATMDYKAHTEAQIEVDKVPGAEVDKDKKTHGA